MILTYFNNTALANAGAVCLSKKKPLIMRLLCFVIRILNVR